MSAIPELRTLRDLSIYVTGSYGRLEAHERSDLDLFFISNRDVPIDRTTKILIDAQLIRIARDMGFPPFSNDAQYLQIHSLNEMLDSWGLRKTTPETSSPPGCCCFSKAARFMTRQRTEQF